MRGKNLLLIISGSIAAYKSLELIRRVSERGVTVRCILTRGGAEFITPLSVASLSGQPVYTDLFSLKDETEMGHIRLSREADLVLLAPASADRIAKLAHGLADDLAGAVLLANNKPLFVAPAMNSQMWNHPATKRNLAQVKADGATIITPAEGLLACGETGPGRMAEVETILAVIEAQLSQQTTAKPLSGRRILVTSGPTHEPIDPVRYIANCSSGKQGHAIARALADAGAEVVLISGPVHLPDPTGVSVTHVETASEMMAACDAALPVDAAICVAAVADWRSAEPSTHKWKKRDNSTPPTIALVENPDILQSLSQARPNRPALVVGFAAETGDLAEKAREKRMRKGCDWLLANDVSEGAVFGAEHTQLLFLHEKGEDAWPPMGKDEAARQLARAIADYFSSPATSQKGAV